MTSPHSPDHSPGEEAYYTADEDRSCYAQSSSGASSIVPTTPNRSVYATANQTPTASPDMNRDTASSFPMVAQDRAQVEALRPIEGSPEKGRERASSDATVAPREQFLTPRAQASTYLGRQRAFLLRLSRSGESQKEEDAPDSPIAQAHDKPSYPRPSGSRSRVNDSPPTDLVDPLKNIYTARRDTSDRSYVYRPTPIDVDPQHQTSSSLPTSPPPTNTTSPAVSNRTTNPHQVLDPIEEDEMPYDPFGNFIMNPLAPVFVPRQGGQPSRGGQPGQGSQPAQGGRPGATRARNPHIWMDHGLGQPSADPAPAGPTTPTSNPPTPDRVPLYGAAHGLFYEPRTALFTGDGPPRTTPHRPDGTLPSQPDPESDFLTHRQYPAARAQDQLHIQPRREYVDRMANFGRNGPVQRFRIARPAAQMAPQEGNRVVVQREDGQGEGQGRNEELLGPRRGMHTANDDEEEEDEDDEGLLGGEGLYSTMTGRPGASPEEIGAELARLTGRIARGEPVEREFQADAGEMEDDEETVVDEGEQGRWYVGPPPF